MIDPIDAILFSLLLKQTEITTDDVCFWDSARAMRVLFYAGMVRTSGTNTYTPGENTAEWMTATWEAIRIRPLVVLPKRTA